MHYLQEIHISGFKSIRDQTLILEPLNVLIGANGTGKSNFIETFLFLRHVINQNLAGYTAMKEGADNLLFLGRRVTPHAEFRLTFSDRQGAVKDGYCLKVLGTDADGLVVGEEGTYDLYPMLDSPALTSHFTPESQLKNDTRLGVQRVLQQLLGYGIYHFHDTSTVSRVRGWCNVNDCNVLHAQGKNLAAYLYRLQETQPTSFGLIESSVRQVAPFFDSFYLTPSPLNKELIQLAWKERGNSAHFRAASLSDGTLRFICLATLLLQPFPPPLLLLDEPELGLHPHALVSLVEMLRSASRKIQIIVATQSVTLVNQLTPSEVWCVDRVDGASVFQHLKDKEFVGWLEGYALGDHWEKNLIWQEGQQFITGGSP